MEFENLGVLRVQQLAHFVNKQSVTLRLDFKRLKPVLRLLASFGMQVGDRH
jgi:hypothetical protein